MTNANPYLPPRRRPPSATVPVEAADVSPSSLPARNDAPVEKPTELAAPRVTAQPSRARRLRTTLRRRDGFFSALQTAELLQPPVSLRRQQR